MSMWHSKDLKSVLSELETREEGLSSDEAKKRLEQFGENRLSEGKHISLIRRLLGQLKDPMILVLLGAAALSLSAGGGHDWLDAAIILLIVVINACISISQEDNARRALEALQEMSAPMARVLRDGKPCRIDAAMVVPGDVILLEAGDYIPADARILSAVGLKTDESSMTGESFPVSKASVKSLPAETALGDRKNMVISATVVTAGRGTAVVTATGMQTEMGAIAAMLLHQPESETPLQQKMAEISKTLSFACLCICGLMLGVGLLQQRPLAGMFMTAISLAVAAIPEGLPAIVTIVLAMGVRRMANYNAIVKKLPAVETLGCASVICSDKTGTLTQNKMTIVEVWTPADAFRQEALTLGALCNDAVLTRTDGGGFACNGDPTECAFIDLAMQEGIDKNELDASLPRRGEVPFESNRKRMATLHALPNGGWRIAVKGAPDALIPLCTSIRSEKGSIPLSRREAARLTERNDAMAGKALRVLGVAYRDLAQRPVELSASFLERELTFVGLLGMIDPPRPEVRSAVAQCYAAGIRPVMITGDHKETAVAIAKSLSIFKKGDLALTGEDLDFLPQEVLESEIDKLSVFARVTPAHKLRIVRAWQKRGNVVAMTGDGVNDAPALKSADIGCAMGQSGTDVAKGAADMILMDDNFTSVVHAVRQGRGIYANIKKAIHYLLSCNIGELLTIFTATVANLPMPLLPVQLLWLNLVTDSLPALALGMEPVEDGVMQEAPREANKPLFSRSFTIRLVWQGVMVGVLTLLAYFLGTRVPGSPEHAMATANTMAFATLTFCQLFHAYDVRSETMSLMHIGIFSNHAMNKAFTIGMLLQLAVLCLPPMQVVFSVTPLEWMQWLTVLGLAILPLLLCELEKAIRRQKAKQKNAPVTSNTIPFPSGSARIS